MSKPKRDKCVGSWERQKQLGSGGQAEVWRVAHSREKHTPLAALKLCMEGADEKAIKRFARETELLEEHQHEHIIAVRDRGVHQGRPFVVMELGTASFERIAEVNASPGVRVLRHSPTLLLKFFDQVCSAIAHLHAQDVLHRDIKPSNVLLMAEAREPLRAVVSDLGIATKVAEQGALTATAEVVGTPIYRAPEVRIGLRATPESDVYGLGRLLEFLVTHTHPTQLEPELCPRGRALSDALCDRLDGVIAKACAHRPSARYSSATEMRADLPKSWLDIVGPRRGDARFAEGLEIDDRAALVLGTLIGLANTPESPEPLRYLRAQLSNRLDGYHLNMALRFLQRIGFVQIGETSDFDGDPIATLLATGDAYVWAETESERIAELLADSASSSSDGFDDDIPF